MRYLWRTSRLFRFTVYACFVLSFITAPLLVDQFEQNHVNVCRWLNSHHGLCG